MALGLAGRLGDKCTEKRHYFNKIDELAAYWLEAVSSASLPRLVWLVNDGTGDNT
jgi:hypothetical protein